VPRPGIECPEKKGLSGRGRVELLISTEVEKGERGGVVVTRQKGGKGFRFGGECREKDLMSEQRREKRKRGHTTCAEKRNPTVPSRPRQREKGKSSECAQGGEEPDHKKGGAVEKLENRRGGKEGIKCLRNMEKKKKKRR